MQMGMLERCILPYSRGFVWIRLWRSQIHTARRPRRGLPKLGGGRLLGVRLEPDIPGAVPVSDVGALGRLGHVELDRAWMEDALAGANAELAAGRDGAGLRLLA